jgi:hypothetical protein
LKNKIKSKKIYENWLTKKDSSLDFIKEIKGMTHEEDIELSQLILYMQDLGMTYLNMINKFKDEINYIKNSEL